jgi:hypothetical protein
MRYLLASVFLIFSHLAVGQEQIFKYTIHYPSNEDKISLEESEKIRATMDSIKLKTTILSIEISSHTDSVGSFEFNQDLSNRRAAGVAAHMVQNCGMDSNQVTQSFHGFSKPIGAGNANRRTEILVRFQDVALEDEMYKLYALLRKPHEEFWISSLKDTVLVSKNGLLYGFEAKSFSGSRRVRITIEEHFTISDMLMHQLTTTSGGELLETAGMFKVEAFDEKGRKIQMRNSKQYWTIIPNRVTPNPYRMFDGHFNQDSIIDWIPDPGLLENVEGPTFGWCRLGGGSKANCPLFFCKMRKWFGQNMDAPVPTGVNFAIATDWHPCSYLEALRVSLGIESMDYLMKNLDSILLAEYQVSSFEEYKKMLNDQRLNNIEQAMEREEQPSASDLNFFIQQSTNLNWRNIDYFLNVPRPISLRINTNQTFSTQCFLVFKKQQVIIPLPPGGGDFFELKAAPKNTDAFLVILQFSGGQPAIIIQEINTDDETFHLIPEPVSIEQLKEELKTLDRGRSSILAKR